MQVKLTRDHGVLKVDIAGKLYNPLSFKSFRPNPRNVSEFYEAGVRLFSVLSSGITCALGVPYSTYGESWAGEYQYDFTAIDRQLDMFIANAPEGYFAPMLQVDTREWYLQLHPECPNSFTHLSQAAWDETWRRQAADYIKAAITHIEERYGDRIYGYFLLGGMTTEWFSSQDYEASHPIKEAGFRRWGGDNTAALPSLERLNRSGRVFLEEDEEDVVTARRFHNETVADLILYFAGEAQAVLQHRKLLGVYYGYLLELGGERLFNDGSLAYEKVFHSPDIDMISSPSSYGYRKLTDPSAFMVTQKTLDTHHKLYFLEFDHRTHLAPRMLEDASDSRNRTLVEIPGADAKCANEMESLNLMYRDFVLCNANLTALWWFDMFDGWFRSPGMMGAVKKMIALSEELSTHPAASAAEIAVFAGGEAMYRVRKSAGLATVCLSNIRRVLAECGAPYDLYTLSDVFLPETEHYKLYVFINAYELTDEVKTRITAAYRRQGKTVLWLYAPDYAHGEGQDVSRITAITGITVTQQEKSHGGMVVAGASYDYGIAAPYFAVEDNTAVPLAHFEDGAVAAAYRKTDGCIHVYVATCNLPADMLRQIADLAGVRVYSRENRVYTYVNSQMVGVYNATEVPAQLALSDGLYIDKLTGEQFLCRDGMLTLPVRPLRAYLLKKEE